MHLGSLLQSLGLSLSLGETRDEGPSMSSVRGFDIG